MFEKARQMGMSETVIRQMEIYMKDENVKKQAELDQASAVVAESFPPLWRRLYENCMAQGFDKRESLRLVCFYILSNGNIIIQS